MPSKYAPDLQHRDWLINVTLKQLQKVDPNIRFKISNPDPEKKVLIIDNVSEESLAKLFFQTNTAQNNNYGYIDVFSVYLQNDVTHGHISVPGLFKNVVEAWHQADAEAFGVGDKYMLPFYNPFTNPYTGLPISIPEFVDIQTQMLPWGVKTLGKEKLFQFIFNPDYIPNMPNMPTLPPAPQPPRL